jgi:hypothetical protein
MAERLSFSESVQQLAQDAFYGMQQAYNDILVHGRLMAHGTMDRQTALNMEIAEDSYRRPEPEEVEPYRGYGPPEEDRGIEPEK